MKATKKQKLENKNIIINKDTIKWFMKEIHEYLSGHDGTMDYNFELTKDGKGVKVYERQGYKKLKDGNLGDEKKPKYLYTLKVVI